MEVQLWNGWNQVPAAASSGNGRSRRAASGLLSAGNECLAHFSYSSIQLSGWKPLKRFRNNLYLPYPALKCLSLPTSFSALGADGYETQCGELRDSRVASCARTLASRSIKVSLRDGVHPPG